MAASRIRVIDSHTGGEPTRVVIDGGPDLGAGSLAERRERFRTNFDAYRSALVNEPRGSDVMVGAFLTPPHDPSCTAGIIFFNNVGYLGMCGHGTIGAIVTLGYLGRIQAGTHRLETPVGVISAEYDGANHAVVANVPSYRYRKDVALDVEGLGKITGDIAWGGNWFFLVNDHRQTLDLANVETLTDVAWKIRQTLTAHGITGADGAEIDHIELFGEPKNSPPPAPPLQGGETIDAPLSKGGDFFAAPLGAGDSILPPPLGKGGLGGVNAHSRNFVLCPGKAYDRSPCGTGTSAKIACLLADGKLQSGERWRQESIVGTVFEAWGELDGCRVRPFIRGSAYITADTTLLLDDADPFQWGIRG